MLHQQKHEVSSLDHDTGCDRQRESWAPLLFGQEPEGQLGDLPGDSQVAPEGQHEDDRVHRLHAPSTDMFVRCLDTTIETFYVH